MKGIVTVVGRNRSRGTKKMVISYVHKQKTKKNIYIIVHKKHVIDNREIDKLK